jgi:hypothetical protein
LKIFASSVGPACNEAMTTIKESHARAGKTKETLENHIETRK